MPMIDVYRHRRHIQGQARARQGSRQSGHALGAGAGDSLVPRQHRGFHPRPARDAISNAAGDSNYVRVQVLTPVHVLDRNKQLGVVKELTEIVVVAAGDPGLAERTWVLITESPEGGWGIDGHANTSDDIVASARAALQELTTRS